MRDETTKDEASPVKTKRGPRRKLVDISALSAADPLAAIDEDTTARLCGVARITMTQWRARGEAPPHFKCGRSIRYVLRDVLAWRDARTVGRRAP